MTVIASSPLRALRASLLGLPVLLAACGTGVHGSFSRTTFYDETALENYRELGPVRGESRQNWVLWFWPVGQAATAAEALDEAMAVYPETVFLSDVVIQTEGKMLWGYTRMSVVVQGTAWTADRIDRGAPDGDPGGAR